MSVFNPIMPIDFQIGNISRHIFLTHTYTLYNNRGTSKNLFTIASYLDDMNSLVRSPVGSIWVRMTIEG